MIKGKVGIIGCGWLGYRLAQHLKDTFEIHATVTTESKIELLRNDGFHPEVVNFESNDRRTDWNAWHKLSSIDHIIITVPLFSKRINANVLHTRIRNLSSFISQFKGTLILMSSIGVYQSFSGEVTEEMLPAENCAGEKEIKELFSEVNILRLGGLMGDDRLLSNYKVTEMDAKVNHIHFYDICRVVQLLIENAAKSRVYNVVAPRHPSKQEVINSQQELISVSSQTQDSKVVLSQKIIHELGYDFLYPDPRYFHLPNNSAI